MRITKIPLIIALLLATMPLCGQTEKKVFSIEDAVLYAKENNLDIKISRNDLELSKLKNNTSWNSISPTAEINGNISDDFENDKKGKQYIELDKTIKDEANKNNKNKSIVIGV